MQIAIKNCGLQTISAIDVAVETGANYLGFIHYPKSARHVSHEGAASLSLSAPAEAQKVAVLVNPSDAEITSICELGYADLLQLHGDEPPERTAAIKAQSGLGIIKAVGISEAADLMKIGSYEQVADHLLLDTKSPEYGGTGESFDWSLLQGMQLSNPWFLSGGLNAHNIIMALEQTHAPMVDVSSGIEREKGVKDETMIEQFNALVRGYAS